MDHKIVNRDINSLIFAEYNPRQLTKDQYKNLRDSIDRFGLVDPIIVNKNKDRKNIIIGGHQRVKVAKDMKIEVVPCLELDLTYEKERELNVRLNRNTGEWDMDSLANFFDVDELMDWGFNEKEFNQILNIPVTDDKPEMEVSLELMEEHNYVLFYFDNTLDWNVAKEKLDIKVVHKEGDTETYKNQGVGRVKNGKDLLKLINEV